MSAIPKSFLKNTPTPDDDEGQHRKTSGRHKSDAESEPVSVADPVTNDSTDTTTIPDPAPASRRGRPRNADTIKERGASYGLRRGMTRYTLVISEERLLWYRDYAYTNRISMREAIDSALSAFQMVHRDDKLLPDPKARQ